MRTLAVPLALAAACLAAGCTSARVGVGTPMGIIYKDVVAPMSLERKRGPEAGQPVAIPPVLVDGVSTGYALDLSIPGLEFTRPFSIGWGDMSLERAMREGGLERVVYADGRETTILRIFQRARVVAYGPPALEAEAAP
ncbi:MAG: hypothetical protein SF028_12925 [Candidatus Sumerlaeia bacterium]|nr:hypothetical protein [Candidatus Sumerlaeia bacterium]